MTQFKLTSTHKTITQQSLPLLQAVGLFDRQTNTNMALSFRYFLLLCLIVLVFASQAQAFGAGSKWDPCYNKDVYD